MSLLKVESIRSKVEDRVILDGVDVHLEAHGLVALLGPNGSGKTTLLKSIAGVSECGSLKRISPPNVSDLLYVGSGIETSFPMTTEEVFLAAGLRDADACRALLQELDCDRIWGKEVRRLSAGERQILLLARSFLRAPSVLLLDETLSKLDLHHLSLAIEMLKRFCQKGGAAIWVSHDWNLSLQHSESAWVLLEGRWIARGKVQEILWPDVLSQVFPRSNVRAKMQSGRVNIALGSTLL